MEMTVQDLAVMRGGRMLLHNVSFTVPKGTALILRGPNGAGKTTLLRTLAGLQPAQNGQMSPGAEAIVYASHADGIKSTLSVEENLEFWADVFGTPRKAGVAQALTQFDLTLLRFRPGGSLSAGQKRRLGLARLVLTGRPIWLLDEPTVSLDKDSVARFADVVRSHLAEGGIAVIATHIDLGLEGRVLDISDFRPPVQSFPDPFGGTFDDVFEAPL